MRIAKRITSIRSGARVFRAGDNVELFVGDEISGPVRVSGGPPVTESAFETEDVPVAEGMIIGKGRVGGGGESMGGLGSGGPIVPKVRL